MSAKRAQRWGVVYHDSKNGWSAFTLRARTYVEARIAAYAHDRLEKGRAFYLRSL